TLSLFITPHPPRSTLFPYTTLFRSAIISASRNMDEVLAAAGLSDLFAVRVNGRDAEKLGLPGKPDPAVFLEAARRLGAEPARARSEEHTSELQSLAYLVCRLLLEKK